MKLFDTYHMHDGMIMPKAHIAFGRIDRDGYYFNLTLPLFILDRKYHHENDSKRFGWWNPRFAVKYKPGLLKWFFGWEFNSDLMGVRDETDSMGYDLNDPNALRNLPIYRRR